jgi:hypothetical protein
MEHLKTDIRAISTQFSADVQNLSKELLTEKVRAVVATIQKDTTVAPRRVKEMVQQAFLEYLGWDVLRLRVTNPKLFTVAGLNHCLRELLCQLNNWAPAVNPTDQELHDLSAACARLWELDVHRLVPDRDYELNLQQGKYAYDTVDAAKAPLFSYVDEKALLSPTFATFIALLDNYTAHTGVSEVVTLEERAENAKFLNLAMDTAVMQYVHKYLLLTKKTTAADREHFIRDLEELWFGLYSRKARNDSSGFEHVFVGEINPDTKEIVGFHNWIQIYLEERNSLRRKDNTFDYRGYIKPKRRARSAALPPSTEQLVTIQFQWHGALKNVSSSLIGTSPEFELALYTLCFYSGQEEAIVKLGPYKAKITSYRWPAAPKPGQKVYVATSFPSEAPLDENEVRSF